MINELFLNLLKVSNNLRDGYIKELGQQNDNWEFILKSITSEIPEILQIIYGNVSGTKRNIKEQKFMDFIPGYRLIHIEEIAYEMRIISGMISINDRSKYITIIPILANYSSDYVCYVKTVEHTEYICDLRHGECDLIIMHNSSKDFLETIIEFYKRKVYFLDSDDYLDYEYEKELIVGKEMNKNVEYWN